MTTALARHRETLATLAADVVRLRTEVDRLARATGELLDGEEAAELANNRHAAAKALLAHALSRHFDEVQRACPDHGIDQLVVTCKWCCEAWGYSASRVA